MGSALAKKTAILLAVAGASLSLAQAQTARVYGIDDDRYSICEVDEGWLRLNRRTGQVALCWPEGGRWICEPLPEDSSSAGKFDAEIARLRSQVSELREALAQRPAKVVEVAPAEPPHGDSVERKRPEAQTQSPAVTGSANGRDSGVASPKDAMSQQAQPNVDALPPAVAPQPTAPMLPPAAPSQTRAADATSPRLEAAPSAPPGASPEQGPSLVTRSVDAIEQAWQSLIDIMGKLRSELLKR